MIAPGIVCPKCKGPMLDERQGKRSDKSPDYTCANMLCVEIKNGKTYRTAIWASANGSAGGEGSAGNSASAPPVESAHGEKPKLTKLYLDATEFVLEKIVPKFEEKEIGLSDTALVAAIATIFIAAAKER